MLIYLIIILVVLDYFGTKLYCYKENRKYRRNPNTVVSSGENGEKYKIKPCLPMRILKYLFYLNRGWIRYKLRLLGLFPCHKLRIFLLKHLFYMNIKKNVVIYGGFEIRDPWKITIDEGTIIGDESKLDGRNGLSIGKNVNFSTGVWCWTNQHDLNDPLFRENDKGGPIVIKDRAWVSSRTVILPNTVIGEGCVVAAGAVVTKSTGDYDIVGGVPAKKIGNRNNQLEYCFNGTHEAFF